MPWYFLVGDGVETMETAWPTLIWSDSPLKPGRRPTGGKRRLPPGRPGHGEQPGRRLAADVRYRSIKGRSRLAWFKGLPGPTLSFQRCSDYLRSGPSFTRLPLALCVGQLLRFKHRDLRRAGADLFHPLPHRPVRPGPGPGCPGLRPGRWLQPFQAVQVTHGQVSTAVGLWTSR